MITKIDETYQLEKFISKIHATRIDLLTCINYGIMLTGAKAIFGSQGLSFHRGFTDYSKQSK